MIVRGRGKLRCFYLQMFVWDRSSCRANVGVCVRWRDGKPRMTDWSEYVPHSASGGVLQPPRGEEPWAGMGQAFPRGGQVYKTQAVIVITVHNLMPN